jgi:hypothetical protein
MSAKTTQRILIVVMLIGTVILAAKGRDASAMRTWLVAFAIVFITLAMQGANR